MNELNNIKFIITDDKSVGMYDENIKDIMHSKTGALREATEKFIIPANILNKKNLKVLDICYGAGYNSKSLLNLMPDNNILIDALEINKDFIFLSPFLNDGIDNIELKLFLIKSILNNSTISADFIKFINVLKMLKNTIYFNTLTDALVLNFYDIVHINNTMKDKNAFLHNIYYNYISYNKKYNFNANKYANSNINYYVGDARRIISSLDNKYDVIFLDGYSPQKDPTLWTINFLSLIKSKMNNNSVLTSYSKSSAYRSALLKLGFHVGKTFIDNIDMGTVASLSTDKIINSLNEYDIELLSTKAGIPYYDPELNLTPEEIIKKREDNLKTSDLISHSAFLKKHEN